TGVRSDGALDEAVLGLVAGGAGVQVQRQCELEEVLALVPVDLDGDLELRSALGQAELDTEGGIPAGAIHGDPGGALCAVAPGRGVDGADGRRRVGVCRA